MSNLEDVVNKQIALITMFKGEQGTRKSSKALCYPKPQYWIPVDRKMGALILPARKLGLNLANDVTYFDSDIKGDWMSILDRLKKIQVGEWKYKTLIIDSITSLGDAINRQTMKLKMGTTTKGGDEKGGRIAGIPINTLEDYKAEASAFAEMTSILLDIRSYHNCEIIMIAHVVGGREVKENEAVSTASRIIITGGKNISGKIPIYCEEIYHFDVKALTESDPRYRMFTTHSGMDYARTTLPLPGLIDNIGEVDIYKDYILPAKERLAKGEVK